MKKFIDDISVLAVENCLVQKLPSLFTPQRVYDLIDDDISRLATESEQTRSERARYTEEVSALETALSDLRRLDKHRSVILGKFTSHRFPNGRVAQSYMWLVLSGALCQR